MPKRSPTLLCFWRPLRQELTISDRHMFTFLSFLRRWVRAGVGLAGLMLLAGCKFDINFWQMDGHQTTMVTSGPVAQEQLDIFMVTVWVTLVIFILVGGVLAYATFKFRA